MINSLNIKNVNGKALRKKRSAGFTLIEVMLALAVFSIAGIALLGTASNNARNIGYLETKMFAGWVASNQLVAVNLDKTWPPKNNVKGEVKLAGRTWYWHKKVIKTTDNDMRSVVIEIRKDPDDELAVSSLTTFVSKVES